jgi:hypothetical protein
MSETTDRELALRICTAANELRDAINAALDAGLTVNTEHLAHVFHSHKRNENIEFGFKIHRVVEVAL